MTPMGLQIVRASFLQGYQQHPDQYYLTSTQYDILSFSERFK